MIGPTLVVAGRQGGKTQAALEWLVAGYPVSTYPGWSRVLVSAWREGVVDTTRRLRELTESMEAEPWVHDLRKCVWSVDDLQGRSRGLLRGIEVGIDDVEIVLCSLLRTYSIPTFMTMTGQKTELAANE